MLNTQRFKRDSGESAVQKKSGVSAAQIRIQSDLDIIELPSSMRLEISDMNNLMQFILSFTPESGIYKGGNFVFDISVGQNYPIDPPKVRLRQRIWHPNIDLNGAICLNILREDWRPVLSLNHVAMGIQFLFLEPNINDPLNTDAAKSFQESPDLFAAEVKRAMRGESFRGIKFDKVL